MINARLKSFKINIPHFGKDEDVFICENYPKTTYMIVIPRLNWGYKLQIEASYEDMKKRMIESLAIYNFTPSDAEEIVRYIFHVLFNGKDFGNTTDIKNKK